MMAKRAYYTVQSVVSDLINDEACYPDRTNSATTKRIGFDDGTANANCRAWNDTATYNFDPDEGGEDDKYKDANLKFITLFLDKFGLKTNSDDVTYDNDKQTIKFKTRDGMYWGIWKADADKGFDKEATDGGYYYIAVDVNGEGSKPNCTGNGTGTGNHGYTGELGNGTTNNPACTNADTRKNGFDRFRMKVMADGGVEIEESDVLVALRVSSDEEVLAEMEKLQTILLDETTSIEEKNDAYTSLQILNSNKGKESNIEDLILKEFNYKSFVKINNDHINITIANNKHNSEIANNIIKKVQEQYDTQMYITIKFQK